MFFLLARRGICSRGVGEVGTTWPLQRYGGANFLETAFSIACILFFAARGSVCARGRESRFLAIGFFFDEFLLFQAFAFFFRVGLALLAVCRKGQT